MPISAVSYASLQPGDDLPFFELSVADLGEPSLDPRKPERHGNPNYDRKLFWAALVDALGSAGVANPVRVVIGYGGRARNVRPIVAIYFDADSTAAGTLVDDTGNLAPWIEAITAGMGDRAVELHYDSSSTGAGVMPRFEETIADPADWLKRSAPNSWEARAELPEKERILQAAQAAAGPPVESDNTQIPGLWAEIASGSAVEATGGASSEDLARFKDATGFAMPEGLAVLLGESDGATNAFGQYLNLMSVEHILREWQGWKQIFDDFMVEDLTRSYHSDENRTVAMYTTPFWVPFIDEATGNFVAVDLLPGPAGRRGQIIYFGADEFTIRVLAADLGDFLRRQIAWNRSAEDPDELWWLRGR